MSIAALRWRERSEAQRAAALVAWQPAGAGRAVRRSPVDGTALVFVGNGRGPDPLAVREEHERARDRAREQLRELVALRERSARVRWREVRSTPGRRAPRARSRRSRVRAALARAPDDPPGPPRPALSFAAPPTDGGRHG